MADKLSAAELAKLGEEIAEQAVHLDAAMHRLLGSLRRFDEAYGWQRQGFDSCAHWLSYRVGWDLATSRERVRVARALVQLPKVDEALAMGHISYSKARAITRVATPATEPTLLKYAERCTASQLETVCRKFHAAEQLQETPAGALPRELDRYVVATPTSSGMVCIKAMLRADEAALLMHVLQKASGDGYSATGGSAAGHGDAQRRDAEGCPIEGAHADGGDPASRDAPPDVSAETPDVANLASISEELAALPAASARPMRAGNRADGLMVLAQAYLRGSNSQRSPIELIVTTTASMLHDPSCKRPPAAPLGADEAVSAHDALPATAVTESNLYLTKHATRRLACDCGLVEATVDEHGEPLSIGRKTRTIPAAIKRALRLRDRTCRFPGCDHRLYLDGHHLKHWAEGGETSTENLCLLCATHHTYVHEHGYRISRDDQGALTFFDPQGYPVVAIPPRPNPPGLGWPAITAANSALELDPSRLAPRGGPSRLDLTDAVGRLFKAKGTPQPASSNRAQPKCPARDEQQPEPYYDEASEDEELQRLFWEGGKRVDELLEWSLAELAATGIDPMAQVPQPYCAPPDWRIALAERMAQRGGPPPPTSAP